MIQNKLKSLIIFTLSFLLLYANISCSQTTPEIAYGSGCVIFDYENETKLPEARLGVFVETHTDSRRYEKIKVTAVKSELSWEVNQVVKFQNRNDKQFAGYTNLLAPKGQKIPYGLYQAVYTNANGDKAEIEFDLSYDQDFYNLNAKQAVEKLKKSGSKCQILVYSDDSRILYYGDKSDNLSTSRKIWNKYKNATHYIEIWPNVNGTVLCVMPPVFVVPDEK